MTHENMPTSEYAAPGLLEIKTHMNKKEIILNKKQIELLNTIQGFKYIPFKILTRIAIEKELYSFPQNLSRVTLQLENEGLLKSFLYGNNWKVLYITRKGAIKLAKEKGIPVKDISIPNYKRKLNFAGLEHTVKIAEIYIELLNKLKQNKDANLIKWIGDQHLYLQYSFRSNRSGKIIKRNLVPDSYFEIEREGKTQKYFLEYDTGSMDREQLSKKFMRYFEYFVYGNWKERFEEFPSILFITERSERALQNLIQEDEIPLEKALSNRSYFMNSKNIVWKGVGSSENVKSINSNIINGYLTNQCYFTFVIAGNYIDISI